MSNYVSVLRKYAVFSGRASRKEYWMFTLINLIVGLGLVIVAGMVSGMFRNGVIAFIIPALYMLATIIPHLAALVRRLHDINLSGWLALIVLIPSLGGLILIILAAIDSTPGDNEYGPNPKGILAPTITANANSGH